MILTSSSKGGKLIFLATFVNLGMHLDSFLYPISFLYIYCLEVYIFRGIVHMRPKTIT